MTTVQSRPKFNAKWYLARYPDVEQSGMDPLEHYLAFGKSEGRQPGPEPMLGRMWRRIKVLRLAVLAAVRHAGGVRPAISKALQVATREGWLVPEFDADFYLQQYPDVGTSGVDPYQHFIQHGRAEGRIGIRPQLDHAAGMVPVDQGKPTILVVSHEASLTGAPILSLNLVRGLRKKYNVVSLLLGDGPLGYAFKQESVEVVGPVRQRHSAAIVADAIAQLTESHTFKFAIVNSVESAMALEPLAKRSVPCVALVHEFASYTRPKSVFRDVFFWADEVVFSTRLTHSDALATYPALSGKRCEILPQGRCEVFANPLDSAARADEVASILAQLRPVGLPEDTLLVVGMGSVHIRKGVDLFIECAAKVLKAGSRHPCRFVWIGRGYNPDHDLAYSVYLADQVRRHGIERSIQFMGDTPNVDAIYEASDVLLLTSRLDPLPNVAIDAMSHGRPVVCFDKTTGIAEILQDHGMADECVAPYLDTDEMAARVIALANSEPLLKQVGERLGVVARDTFDMDRYIQRLDAIALEACDKVAIERDSAEEIQRSALQRDDYLAVRAGSNPVDAIRWQYVRPWTSGIQPRKPFPGFHPGVYGEHAAIVGNPTIEPFARYLRAGRPDGPWHHDVISADDAAMSVSPSLRIALHVHAYYPELMPEVLGRLNCNQVRPDLMVSVPTAVAKGRIEQILKEYDGESLVEVVPNRGRDIGPMLTTFGPALLRDYHIVGHLHTKKTNDVADTAMGERWRHFLFENLLGGKSGMADKILGRMSADPSIGLVFPDDPHVVDWGKNRVHAEALCRQLRMTQTLPNHFVFPVGTMFWARVEALRPLLELGLDWDNYPGEPLPYDGTMLHALERLLPFVAADQELRSVLTNVAGVSR